MKRANQKLCLILSILLVLFQVSGIHFDTVDNQFKADGAVEAATTYSWNNTTPMKAPTSGGNGKLILFDNSHGETAGAADWVIDGGFSDFADALVAAGYTVKEYRGVDLNGDGVIRYYDDRQTANQTTNEAIITYDAIKDAAVFVMAEPNRPFKTSEYAALKQFVDSGKGIYFIADHYNADRNMNTWDATEIFNGYNRSTSTTYNMGGLYGDLRNPQVATSGWLAENFGLRFRFNAIDYKAGVSGVKPASQTEGITSGVGPILMAAGATLAITDPNKAKGLVYFSSTDTPVKWSNAADQGLYFGGEAEGPYVAISKPSAGKAAFIGDSSPIEDITPKYKREDSGANKSTHDGWKNAGNAATLSLNIINWLATPETYVGFDGVTHPKGIATPTPMATVEMTQSQAEPWATPSYDPWNTDTFAAGSYNAPTGTTSGGGTTPTGSVQIGVYPTYVYVNEPFGVTLGGTATNPEFGAYFTSGGTQVGQVYQNGVWSASGYTAVTGTTPLALTARVTSYSSSVNLRARTSSTSTDTRTTTCLSTGYGYLQGAVSGLQGEVVAAIQGGAIVGTARIDAAGQVRIACKAGSATTLALYGVDGAKKADLSGSYTVTSGATTTIASTSVAVTGVTLNKASTSINVGATETLVATVNPTNATNKSVTWSSSNTSVATVSSTGVVTAVAAGTATITVTTVDGAKTATCAVTVTSQSYASGSVYLKVYPAYVYTNQPFAIGVAGNTTGPQFGAYNSTGTQFGQVYNGSTWSASGYNALSGTTPIAATVRVVSYYSTTSLKVRNATTTSIYDKFDVTGMNTGYGWLQGTVNSGSVGDIVAAVQNGVILGTAQIESTRNVKIACKSGTGITLALYGPDGTKKADLIGTYSVSSSVITTITDN